LLYNANAFCIFFAVAEWAMSTNSFKLESLASDIHPRSQSSSLRSFLEDLTKIWGTWWVTDMYTACVYIYMYIHIVTSSCLLHHHVVITLPSIHCSGQAFSPTDAPLASALGLSQPGDIWRLHFALR
jgi:hypothetical protein